MKNDFLIAITQLSAEKNLPKEVVYEAVEAALVSAYKKGNMVAPNQNISVKILPGTGDVRVYIDKTVVEEVTDPRAEISLAEAAKIHKGSQLGDTIPFEMPMLQNTGRIAAQTAKQVVLQRLREAEREVVFEEYLDKEGDVISGVVHRIEGRDIILDLGKTEAVLPLSEQVPTERYRIGQRVKAYLVDVHRTTRGPQLIVSRTHRNLLRRLFELEVPEIYNGVVEIKAIAREPGLRSKVAVSATQEGVDPVGSCVGLRGIRIQNIVNELDGERIDVIQWHPDAARFVANAISPAQALSVEIDETQKTATVVVGDRQLSLAIGKEGQNARLAAKLTGWRVDIKSASAMAVERAAREAEAAMAAQAAAAAAAEEQPVEAVAEAEVAEAPVVEAPVPTETMEAPVAAQAPEAAEPVTADIDIFEPEAPAVAEEAAPEVEEPEAVPVAEFVVAQPAIQDRRQIRFAEEIVEQPSAARPARVKKGKAVKKGATKGATVDRADEEVKVAVVKAKKGKRRYEELDDDLDTPIETALDTSWEDEDA